LPVPRYSIAGIKVLFVPTNKTASVSQKDRKWQNTDSSLRI